MKIVKLNDSIMTEKGYLAICNGCDKIQDIRTHGEECCEGYDIRIEKNEFEGGQTK